MKHWWQQIYSAILSWSTVHYVPQGDTCILIAAYMDFKSVDKILVFKLKLLGSSLHVLSRVYSKSAD